VKLQRLSDRYRWHDPRVRWQAWAGPNAPGIGPLALEKAAILRTAANRELVPSLAWDPQYGRPWPL